MAYIPPHKRHSRDMEKPSPIPELLSPQFNRKLNLRPFAPHFNQKSDSWPSGRKMGRNGEIVYADQAINKWFSIGSSYNGYREAEEVVTEPWVSIVVNLLPELLSSAEHIKNEMYQDEDVKPKLVARIGKILFQWISEIDRTDLPTDTRSRERKTSSFDTNVSESCMKNITDKVIPLIGVEFDKEKDIYVVKLLDSEHPSVILSCKCTALPVLNNLKLYKVELNPVRHMVADILCLKQNVDMRLMLFSKKTLEKLTDDEMKGIKDLINSAVLDKDVKGGLRWPLGKSTSGERFRVIGVWHTVAKSYVNPFSRLKLRNADRYDFRTSIGETSKEVTLKLKQITSQLLRERIEIDEISDMLKDHLKFFWNHFVLNDFDELDSINKTLIALIPKEVISLQGVTLKLKA